jgi:MFS family permease
VSTVLVVGIGGTADPTRAARHTSEPIAVTLGGGLRELRRLPAVAVIVAAFCAQTLVRGLLNVYVVVLALVTLSLGDGGVGLLNAGFGVGVMVGALVATSLVGRRRLSRSFVVGLALWGLPLVAAAVWPQAGIVLAAMAVAGIGNAMLDVSGFTLIQRLVDDRLLGRVFGVMYIGVIATVGLGSILAPVLISALGLRLSLALSGLPLPLLALIVYRRIAAADTHAEVPSAALDPIASYPLFAPLPPLSLVKLARAATPLSTAPGTTVIREGEIGESFYLVIDGTLTVTSNTLPLRRLSAGDGFGEIALLRNVPRSATVEAETQTSLLVIHRSDFLAAVLGTPESSTAANTIAFTYTDLATTRHYANDSLPVG